MAATAIAPAIFLIAPTALAPPPNPAPPVLNAPPPVCPIAWKTCAPTPAPQTLNAPAAHLTVTAALAEQPNPAPQTPTAPAQFLIVIAVLVGRIKLAQLMMIAALSWASPIAMMVFAQQHNAPAIPIAQAPNPIVSAMFAPQLVPPIPNAQVTNLIVSADLARPIPLQGQ